MSCCDEMRIVITNQALGPNGKGVPLKIVGIRDTGTTTLKELSTGQTIDFNRSATGHAKSGDGSKGETYGTITVQVPWEDANETIDLIYNGTPKNQFGWCPCAGNGTPGDSSHYRATVTANPGSNSECAVQFLIQNK